MMEVDTEFVSLVARHRVPCKVALWRMSEGFNDPKSRECVPCRAGLLRCSCSYALDSA